MEKPQRQLAGTIANADEQIAATTIDDFREQDLAADETAIAGLQGANFDKACAILVAVRQQEQQVADAEKGKARELFLERRTDARKNGQRRIKSGGRLLHL
jgi:hypothetical protein